MAASLPTDVLPAHPDELSISEKFAQMKNSSEDGQLSEVAEVGSHHPEGSEAPHNHVCTSQESSSHSLHNFSSEDGSGSLYHEQTSTCRTVGESDVVHPETSCGEDGDVCEGCGRSISEGERMLKLEKDVKRLEELLKEKEQVIASLTEENTRKTAELLEIQLQKLQRTISEKDSAIALLEIQQSTEGVYHQGLEKLRGERGKLTQQLNRKVQERVDLFRKDSDKALDTLANQFQSYSKKQVCEVLRALDRTCVKLKSYIDQLLAVVLEHNPNLLEGMPRIQQNIGMKLELFRVASLQELLEELHEKEQNCQSLQNYAGLLLQRITEQSPNLLESISSHGEQCSELLMAEH